jgi:maleylpyruvate isomerase
LVSVLTAEDGTPRTVDGVTDDEGVPERDLARVASAQERLETAIAALGDDQARRPCLLPGWTVGHLLSHVARNADSHRRRAEAAARGEIVEQYPGGVPARAAEIDDGARRSAAVLIEDVRSSAVAMVAAWRQVDDDAWGHITRDVGGRERPLRALVGRRWQELGVHIVDLGLGVTHRDWSDDFVAVWLPRLRAGAGARLAAGGELPKPGALDERDELAWLYGRLDRDDLPELEPWS